MNWPRSRLYWTALNFGPAGIAACMALSYAVTDGWRAAVMWLLWAGAGLAVANASLSNYRAGYWRGRVEESAEETDVHVRKLLTGWQPNPWDDNRWQGPPPS